MKTFITFLLALISLSAYADTTHFAFKGKMGDDISFRIDLEMDNYRKYVMGETTYYRKNGKTSVIKVYGKCYDVEYEGDDLYSFMLSEFNGTKECGHIQLITNDETFDSGLWSFGEKMYEMKDMKAVPSNGRSYLRPQVLSEADGVYKFSAAGIEQIPDRNGTLQLRSTNHDVAYTLSMNPDDPDETSGKFYDNWQNDEHLYTPTSKIVLTAYEGVVFVESEPTSEDMDPSYTDYEGIYIATSEQPKGAICNAFDEETEFCKNLPFSVYELNQAWQITFEGETTYPDEIVLKDLDGDGNMEIIARYVENRVPGYEVRDNRSAVFSMVDGRVVAVAIAVGKLEEISVADGYVVKTTRNERGSRTTHRYFKLNNSAVALNASKTEAEINNFTIDGKTASEKDFKKQVKVKKLSPLDSFGDWKIIPNNIERNKTAPRG